MSYTLSQFDAWKAQQYITLNAALSGVSSPTYTWEASGKLLASNIIESSIDSLVFTRTLQDNTNIIKQQLMTIYSYLYVRYSSILLDPILESKYAVPNMIEPGVVYTGVDDLRNLGISNQILPDLDLTYWDFEQIELTPPPTATYSYSVSANNLFNALSTNVLTTWAANEVGNWSGIPSRVKIENKTLYLTLNNPALKTLLPSETISPRIFILDNMHFREVCDDLGITTEFIDYFPELA